MFKKNTAVTGFGIGHFINASSGAAVTTGTPTCKRTIDGTGGSCANAASYNSGGAVWEIDLAAGDMNGDVIVLSFTLTDCLPIAYTIKTVTGLPDASGYYPADAVAISGDTTAANTLEEYCDGTTPQPVNVTTWLGTAAATPTTAGVPEVDVTHWLGTACATPTQAGVPEVDVTYVGGSAASGVSTIDANVTQWKGATAPAMTGDAYARLGAPAGASVSADIAAAKSDTAAILVDTGTDGVVLANDAITAAKFDESTAFPLKSADTGATAVARTGADSDTLETLSDEIAALPQMADCLTADDVADAMWEEAIADHSAVAGSTAKAVADILVDTGTTLDTLIKDIPTVAEFEARTLAAASYFDPSTDTVTADVISVDGTAVAGPDDLKADVSALATAAELAKVPKSDSTVSWNATALAAINTQCDTAITDAALATASAVTTVDTVVDAIKLVTDKLDTLVEEVS